VLSHEHLCVLHLSSLRNARTTRVEMAAHAHSYAPHDMYMLLHIFSYTASLAASTHRMAEIKGDSADSEMDLAGARADVCVCVRA
jgi:hypothetical protein